MDNDAGMTALGIGGIGFGILLIYSAYTKQSLFGKDGIIPNLLDTGKFGKTVGNAAGKASGIAFPTQPGTTPVRPPGYGGLWENV